MFIHWQKIIFLWILQLAEMLLIYTVNCLLIVTNGQMNRNSRHMFKCITASDLSIILLIRFAITNKKNKNNQFLKTDVMKWRITESHLKYHYFEMMCSKSSRIYVRYNGRLKKKSNIRDTIRQMLVMFLFHVIAKNN